MATRSFIARTLDSGFEGVYCHYDGYPGYNGLLLYDHYSDNEKVGRLLALGDISVLGSSVGEKHAFESASTRKDTTYYGRDRGDKNTALNRFENLDELVNNAANSGCEFIYLFDENKWRYLHRGAQYFAMNDGSPYGEFRLLAEELVKLNQ